jgi:LuxR family maltose regulon positive regulatory protein
MDDTLQGDTLSLPGLIMTKLYPPRVRDHAVARNRILERLRPEAGIKLTALVAPAGCGKSTTLGWWYELEATRRPVAWLTLDEGDSDPVVLWSYVLEALRTANPGFEVSAWPMQVGSMRIEDAVLPEVVNALVGLGDAALVLDDFIVCPAVRRANRWPG